MSIRATAPLLGSLILVLASCTFGTGPSPSVDRSGAPNPSASPGDSGQPSDGPPPVTIDHPTGSTDVILRFEEGGGFVPLGYLVTQASAFTLYGGGTVVFRDQFGEGVPPGPIVRDVPFRTTVLSEEQVQALLEFALNDGALGIARESYENNLVADAPTAIFTINAGGLSKTVSVYALGLESPGGEDGAARTAFAALAERLRAFDAGRDTEIYEPERYRAVLYDAFGGGAALAWPWPDIAPSDFVASNDPDVPATGFPSRVLTRDEVAAVDLEDIEGGVQGIILDGPDGAVYSLALRPLLPGEEA
jgi:hypothetical protein